MNDDNTTWIELTQLPTTGVTVVQTMTGQPTSLDSLYGQFNLGLHVGDDSLQVHRNRAMLLQSLQTQHPTLNRIHWLNQVHGNDVYHVTDEITATAISADAHITSLPNVALAIMTADCVPIMIASGSGSDNKVVAAVHAGWQGLSKNIIATTIQKMVHQFDFIDSDNTVDEINQQTADWQAWIGASIAQSNYEVDSRVKDAVLATLDVSDEVAAKLFMPNPKRAGHYFADLPAVAQWQLNACGIQKVYQSGLDSHSDERFYSYRQQTQHQLPATGRMATLIFIE